MYTDIFFFCLLQETDYTDTPYFRQNYSSYNLATYVATDYALKVGHKFDDFDFVDKFEEFVRIVDGNGGWLVVGYNVNAYGRADGIPQGNIKLYLI